MPRVGRGARSDVSCVDGAGAEIHEGAWKASKHGDRVLKLADGLPGRGAEGTRQLSVMHEVGAKELRDGEDPLGMTDVGDDLFLEEGRELGGADGTADAGEASLEDAAVEVPRIRLAPRP